MVAPAQFRLVFSTLVAIAVGAILLLALHVFDDSVFVVEGVPRTELLGATLCSFAYLCWSVWNDQHRAWRRRLGVAVLPILAAAASLTWEAVSLVLCPNTLNPRMPAALFEPGSDWLGLDASLFTAELVTGYVAVATAALFFLIVERNTSNAKQRFLRTTGITVFIATLLALLLPLTGPSQGLLPLPAVVDAGANAHAAAAPRTGLICLPVVVVGSLVISTWRDAVPRTVRLTQWLLAASVLVIELLAGRYSLLAVLLALLLVPMVHGGLGVSMARRSAPLTDDDSRDVPASSAIDDAANAEQLPSTLRRVRALLTVVFLFSGMAALVYQVVFAKGLALTFGSTSHASTIVLATYMGGLALGSWLGGRWAARLRRPVIGYALAELGIAAICAVAPWTLHLARWAYVTIAQGTDPGEPWLIALQLGMGALVLVPPTWLMGLTLPLLTRQFLDEKNNLGSSAGLLYTANTLGAAVGACVTGYFILPTLGVGHSLLLAVFTNVFVALFAIIAASWARNARPHESTRPEAVAKDPEQARTASAQSVFSEQARAGTETADPFARRIAWIATIQLTIGGFVTFGLETTFTHLLATVAGTSTYAFSLMLFAFLIGLSFGSSLGRKWLPSVARLPQALLLCQLSLAIALLIAGLFWDYLPAYFASFGRWPYTLGFAAREFVRFVVCLTVMLPAAVCIGAQFPIAMEAVGHGWPQIRIQALGRASALNTVGNILGALVVGFVALPRLGSHRTLGLLTLLCLGLASVALWAMPSQQRRRWFAPLVAVLSTFLAQGHEFDLTRLSAGGNVYFKPQYYGRVIDHAESLDGGLTAVTISYESSREPVKTLLTNGKFQGNNRRDSSGEMMAQTSFAIAPLLHTAQRDRALVIGFGTGTTTRVLDEAGFRQVVVAELSGDIIQLADRHFGAINHGVVHRPNVHVHVTDGRNYLLLDRQRYDVIGIELSSIWFAGAANLYNDEFYALVEPRLSEHGVLQQWIQLHRLSHRDVISILVTLRQRFPRIWLYFLGKQGILIACKHECMPSRETIDRLHAAERLRSTLSVFDGGLNSVLSGRMLTPDGIDRLIEDYRNSTHHTVEDLLSTDDNLYLEYSTPKGNVREYDESIADNEAFLARFRAPNPFEATHLEFDARK